jgi:hypothetical protein
MTTDEQNAECTPRDAESAQEASAEDALSFEQILERTVLYALSQGREKLEEDGTFDPFTVLISGEELYIEKHPGADEAECYASARRTVYQMERLCDAYVLCYDGYLTLDDGPNDALVVEYASKEDEHAQLIALLYHLHDDHCHFDETLYQVGQADTLFGAMDGRPGGESDDGDADGPDAAAEAAESDAGAEAAESDAAAEAASVPQGKTSGTSFAIDPVSGAPYNAVDVVATAVFAALNSLP